MKRILILFGIAILLSGCATVPVDYYTNPNSAGYTQQSLGGLCENCGRMFTVSSAQLYGTTVTPNIGPEGYGLKKGMTSGEVSKILGISDWGTDFLDYNGVWYKRCIDHYKDKGIAVQYINNRNGWFSFDKWAVETWTGPAKVEQDPNAIGNITCPYCGRTQDIRMAANRWTYAVQQQQAQSNIQGGSNIAGQVISGMVLQNYANSQQQINNLNPNRQGSYFNPINVRIKDR